MSTTKTALLAGFLLVGILANAASRNNAMRIKILDSETHSVSLGGNDVPTNCDQVNFDAYCNHSKSAIVTNTLLVQDGNGRPFRIVCTIESRFSRCVPLPKGGVYDARREKHGVMVYYIDDNGKARSQLYAFVAEDKNAVANITMSAPAAPGDASSENAKQASASEPATGRVGETVKCSFSSTPSGADVLLDGRFVGSTPSVLGITTGTHVVVVSMAGFTQWKRELAVTPGSDLTVNAILEKAQ